MTTFDAPQVPDTVESLVGDLVTGVPPATADLCGHTFTLVHPLRQGPFLNFVRRMDERGKSANATRLAAIVRLLEAWIAVDDHDDLYAVIDDIESLEQFTKTDLPKFIEAAMNRPTVAPASSPPG